MFKLIENFSSQIKESFDIVSNTEIRVDMFYENIVCCGMGGSSIGAQFIKENVSCEINIPIFINNEYNLPNWTDKKTIHPVLDELYRWWCKRIHGEYQ